MEEDLRIAAEQALGAAWGEPVACKVVDVLRSAGRSRVWRLGVDGGPATSVILKLAVGADTTTGGASKEERAFGRLVSEWAGCSMLAPLGFGPNLLGGDLARRFCLIEDLGDGVTLADRLLGDDAAAASDALFAYARSLGDLHRATVGAGERWAELRGRLGASREHHPRIDEWPSEAAAFMAYAQAAGDDAPGLEADLAQIGAALAAAPYLAFTPTDCCPDNHFQRGERVVFFDCEGAQLRHALLDAAYFLAPFPTCWCCAAMPEGLPARLVAAYRERFDGGVDFDAQLTLMLAAWLVATVPRAARMGWHDADRPWGLSTMRQRGLALTAALLARPDAAAGLPGLTETVARMRRRLAASWTDVAPMPLYPAFGGPPMPPPS